MGIFDNVRQTLGDAANVAKEVGQNLGAQAQSQINIKKLQLEHAKKLRDLGELSYDWYRSGKMIVTGPVPENVQKLCAELDESSTRLQLEEAKLDETKRQAEQRAQNKEQTMTYSVLPTQNFSADNGTNAPHSAGETAHSGVTIPGTGIHVNPTPTFPDTDESLLPTMNEPIEDGIPAVPASDISGGNLPSEPASDISPTPMPGAPAIPASRGLPSSPGAPGGFGPATM